MTTSGTYSFAPGLGELTLYAFQLIGLRPTSLLQEHMQSARMASNLLLGRWSSQGVNLWQVDLQTISLVQGTATYTVPSSTIAVLDTYIVATAGNRIITPISRSEYASYSNPTQQGGITTYWFDRLLSPTITFYLVPDGTVSQVQYYRLRQNQDADLAGGLAPEMPVYFLEAFAAGLAYRLAMIWAPEKAMGLKMLADEAYQIAAEQNVETSTFYLMPQAGAYYQT